MNKREYFFFTKPFRCAWTDNAKNNATDERCHTTLYRRRNYYNIVIP